MQIADEIEVLKAQEKKWSEKAYNDVNKLIKKLDERDVFLAPYLQEIKKNFEITKIEIKEKKECSTV